MRILHVLDHSLPHHSGYVFRTLSLLREQRNRGWDPIMLTTPRQGESGAACEELEGFKIYRTGRPRGLLSDNTLVRTVKEVGLTRARLQQVIDQVQPQIIHAHSPVLNGWPATRTRRSLPVVYEIRAFWEDAAVDHASTTQGSLRYRLTRAWETSVCRRAQHVFTICQGLKDDLVGRALPEGKITLIPNAVDPQKFEPIAGKDPELLHTLALEGKRVLGFLGSFYAYEGLRMVIEAMPQLLSSCPDVHLLLVGGGPEEARLKAQVASAQLQKHVTFTGRMPQAEVRRYYSLVDALVFARLPMRLTETVTPLKPLEAMALQIPVIASNVGGHRELIAHERTGMLFEAGDRDDLVRTIDSFFRQPALARTLREQGRTYVTQERTWARSVANYAPIYERLAA